MGGGCLVDGGSLAIHEIAGSRKTTNLPAFLEVENRKKVQIPPSSWRTTGVPLWCVLAYCCAAVVGLFGTYCSTAVVLLWWRVGRRVGGGCLVGGGSLAIHEMTGGRETTNLPALLTVLRVLKTPEATKCSSRSGIPPYIFLHCCTAVVAWSVGGGWVVGVLVGG